MPRLVSVTLIAALMFGTVGCGGLQWPRLRRPGPAYFPQQQATLYDPYPEDDLGPPVVGGRPRGYLNPYPQTERLRWNPFAQ